MALDSAAKIFVGGLPHSCDEAGLSDFFGSFGVVAHTEVKRDQLTGASRGFGFVTFESHESVDLAVSMNGQHSMDGKNVDVKAAMAQPPAGKGGFKAAPAPYAPPAYAYAAAYSPKGPAPGKGGIVVPSLKGQVQSRAWSPGAAMGVVVPSQKGPAKGKSWPAGNGIVVPSQQGKSWQGGATPAIVVPSQKGLTQGKAWGTPVGKGKTPSWGSWSQGPPDMGKGKAQGDARTFDRDDAKLFVGGLPPSATEEIITEYFSQFGAVAKVLMKLDPATQLSRGFCFVNFEDAASAAAALGAYDTHELDGKWIEVKSAMVNGMPAPGQKGGGAPVPTEATKIFVGGLPKETGEDQIQAFFIQFGDVTEVLLKKDEAGASKGFAFVSFADETSVAKVLNNHAENQIDGKWIDVKPASAKGEAKGKGYGMAKGGGKSKGWAPY